MTNKKPLISEMNIEERPRERFAKVGVEHLSDVELLALILRTGTRAKSALALADEVLNSGISDTGLKKLYRITERDLLKIDGIGEVKMQQILAIRELSVRLSKSECDFRITMTSPVSVARYYTNEFKTYRQEHLKLLMFDAKNHLIGERLISKGTANASLAEPRDILSEALNAGALSIILIHNHPSGDPTPSQQDIFITKRLYDAGELIGIHLLDHIILADDHYISMKSESMISDWCN